MELTNRTLISLSGHDAPKFLQGLTSNNVDTTQRQAWYTAFLEAHGRVLWDTIIYPDLPEDGSGELSFLIEVDTSTSEAFIKHLTKHRLRSKVQIRPIGDEAKLWVSWNSEIPQRVRREHLYLDPRLPELGWRIISRNNELRASQRSSGADPLNVYTLHRYLHGVAEGPQEIIPSSALPQESNFDHLNGVDFKKGCYLGQELTIRTQHTGVVRKRILPVQLYKSGSLPPTDLSYDPEPFVVAPGTDIKGVVKEGERGSKRSAGKILANIGNVGLALCRLEMMTNLRVSAEGGSYQPRQEFSVGEGVRVKAFVPWWLRQRLEGEREKKGIE